MTTHPHVDAEPAFARPSAPFGDVIRRLNTTSHFKALMVFMVVVLAHWAEHLVQAVQVMALGWPRPESRGLLGQIWPSLVSSEWLHYGYAIAMLAGLLLLRSGFTGRARTWWTAALVLQVWHHVEHLLLLGQALAHHPLFGAEKPTSIVQLIMPRVELHLFYNAVVFTPMVIAMFLQFHDQPRRARIAAGRVAL